MKINFKILLVGLILNSLTLQYAQATGEASTYFNVFVPPNNDAVGRDVCLIVTALYDNTEINIIDDDADGDSDDSYQGSLSAGQSYITYIREGGVNDDAPHSGESATKQDGDYFIIESNKLVFVSQSTNSDWQHDWVPATNKTSKGQKFIIYSPPTSYSNRDLNLFAYEDSTSFTVRRISTATKINTGLTNVNYNAKEIVAQGSMNIGEDIIFYHPHGRDILESGHTYVVETSKPVTAMYGALWTNARDGGGYVTSSNGSSSGELFHFAVPYQAGGEQEIRIVSWDPSNEVTLERYYNGTWVVMKNWTLGELGTAEWVGKNEGNATYNTTFRISCSSGKSVSVFEANWLETGSPGTSDIATMATSRYGTTAGTEFIQYMAPPGWEQNVSDPFTNQKFTAGSHLYIFSRIGANVTVVDAQTNGTKINRTFTIAPDRYVDCYLNLEEWRSIYNGDGNPASGDERPYLLVRADAPISIFNTNFNDNWMSFFGTAQTQDFKIDGTGNIEETAPFDTTTIVTNLEISENTTITHTEVQVVVGDGLKVISSNLNDNTNSTSTAGTIEQNGGITTITFDNEPDLTSNNDYTIETEAQVLPVYENGEIIDDNTVISVETTISGEVDGVYQQASFASAVINNSEDQSNMLFQKVIGTNITSQTGDYRGVAILDFDNDGDEDIYLTTHDKTGRNFFFNNDGTGQYADEWNQSSNFYAVSSASTWADIDNDGDIDGFIANNNDGVDMIIKNNNGNYQRSYATNANNPGGYSTNASWADIDNDGDLDLFVADYFENHFNKLFINDGSGTLVLDENHTLSLGAHTAVGATWADYDMDGLPDLFIPNTHGKNNVLYHNVGNGQFEAVNNIITNDGGNSVGSSWGDYDNDMDLDLFVANAGNEDNFLYRNDGDGLFTKVTDVVSTDKGNSHGSAWGDYDNDGYLDLVVTNDQNMRNFLYHNNGDGSFSKITYEVITGAEGNSFACAWTDKDRDGDLDLFIANHSNEANFLFENNGNSNNYLRLKLIGTTSNTSAIGAKIYVQTTINGELVTQLREVSAQSGGGHGSQQSLIAHFGLGTATHVENILIEWPSGIIQEVNNVDANQQMIITESNGKLIQGHVYHDMDNSCDFSTGDVGIAGQKISLASNKHFYTDANGEYAFYVEPGDYILSYASENFTACDDTISISVNNNHIYNQDFLVAPDVLEADLALEVGVSAFRKGFHNDIILTYRNQGTTVAEEITLQVGLPAELTLTDMSMPFNSKDGNTFTWALGSLAPGERATITLEDSVSNSSLLDKEVTFTALITTASSETIFINNAQTVTEKIVGSVDPNDKLVFPNDDYVWAKQKMHYKIRFQNVGNYKATYVTILDTLDRYLDVSSITQISTSHPAQFEVLEGNILRWYFDHIELPDSTSNEPASHGFVSFHIHFKESIPFGYQVKNDAFIKFDYNDWLQTNEVTSTVLSDYQGPNGGLLEAWPNPMSHMIVLKSDESPITAVSIYELTGQKVKTINLSPKKLQVLKPALTAGVYIFKATTTAGQLLTQKVIVR